jgi:dihydrofolate reductase
MASPRPWRIVGYAIVSLDGMLADRHVHMPDSLKIEADQRQFESGLDAADLLVHGRHSHEGQLNSPKRKRLILTRRVAAMAEDPAHPKAMLWNPAGTPFEDACRAMGVTQGVVAVIGGTDVFGLFLDIGYDAFHLSRANKVQLPGGRPVFPQVPAKTPEQVLAEHGLRPGPTQMLDAQAEATLITWTRA